MAERRRTLRLGLTIILALSLLVCPLSVSGQLVYTPAQAQGQVGQIDFTPHVATVVFPTTTPETTIGAWNWEPGVLLYCLVTQPEHCGLSGLVPAEGDEYFGWGRLPNAPDLRVVWVRDGGKTYFLIVSAEDPLFTGMPDGTSFKELVAERTEVQQYLEERSWESFASFLVPGVIIGLLLLLCPESLGFTCFMGGLTAGGTGGGNVIRNVGMSAPAEDRLKRLESNLLLQFELLKSASQGSQ